MKILGVVITYHPNMDQLKYNIEQYVPYIDHLVVWINTPNESLNKYVSFFKDEEYFSKLEFQGIGKGNQGLTIPMNCARNKVLLGDYDYLLTMDQDSVFDNFKLYRQVAESNREECILIPTINGSVGNNTSVSIMPPPYITLINSGTLYGKKTLITLGEFDRKLFVEGIDTEIALRAAAKGVVIYKALGVCLKQTFSNPSYPQVFKKIRILRKRFLLKNTNKSRIREIVASNIYLCYKYPKYKKIIEKHFLSIYGLKYVIKVILFEKDKHTKITEYFKGFFSGYKLYKR